MKAKIRKQLAARKRRIAKRLDKTKMGSEAPIISASNIAYEIAERSRAIGAGGIGMIHQVVKQLNLDQEINRRVNVLKIYLPYSESDHVLNIAYNLLAGGTCLEHLELRRNDEAYLNALGAQRIPDPTTAGDFCRRFDPWKLHQLMQVFNDARLKVWQQQPDSFFDEAVIEADGTMVETCECICRGIAYDVPSRAMDETSRRHGRSTTRSLSDTEATVGTFHPFVRVFGRSSVSQMALRESR